MKSSRSFKAIFTLLLLLFLLVLMGCSNSDDEFWLDYMKDRDKLEGKAISECNSHGQEYMIHHYDGITWEVICYQKSPFREFRYDFE